MGQGLVWDHVHTLSWLEHGGRDCSGDIDGCGEWSVANVACYGCVEVRLVWDGVVVQPVQHDIIGVILEISVIEW